MIPPALPWRIATVAATKAESTRAKAILLHVPGWPGHLAGQHLDLRLTAGDGYQAQRSYSISSAPGAKPRLEVTVERVDDGEVSPFLLDELRVGDRLELRGPIGGYFTWMPGGGGPLLLVGGGSGVAPLMAILRARAEARDETPVRLLYSARGVDELLYRAELDALAAAGGGFGLTYTLTRGAPEGWTGEQGRIAPPMLAAHGFPPEDRPLAFVCGPTPFVEAIADALVALGHEGGRIRTERFGPTGDVK
ncbi:MAG TPA: FAD-binding oxidoreductase [Thermoanaerobaculia bacterium]|nr:FAD-binding oxidoreductase [Thermoanaerobaculia bacterium]